MPLAAVEDREVFKMMSKSTEDASVAEAAAGDAPPGWSFVPGWVHAFPIDKTMASEEALQRVCAAFPVAVSVQQGTKPQAIKAAPRCHLDLDLRFLALYHNDDSVHLTLVLG